MIDLTNETFTLESEVHFQIGRRGRKQMLAGRETPAVETAGAVPRLARLLALAIRFEGFVRAGEVRDYADIARLGHVTRARVTQIMNLLNLAPDIQEEILFLPPTAKVRQALPERRIRSIAAVPDWRKQRKAWASVKLSAEQG